MASQETPISKLRERETEQQRRERVAHEERKRVIANAERIDPVASVQASVPHILNGIATGPET